MNIKPIKDPDERFDITFRTDRTFDLVGFGQNAVDHILVMREFPRFDAKIELDDHRICAGGQIASALVFASRVGLRCKYIGKTGGDDHGYMAAASLRSENIDVSALRVEPGAASHCSFIMVDRTSGERSILWYRDPCLRFQASELHQADACAGRVLLVDGEHPEASLEAARWAEDAGIPVVVDLDAVIPGTVDLIAHVDFLIVSANFPGELTGLEDPASALAALRPYCRGFLAVTAGAEGVVAMLGKRHIRFPGFPIKAVDTTGAGDVFRGAFVYGLLQNWPLYRIMSFANGAAALNCTRLGARGGIRPLGEILEFLDNSVRS